MQPSVATAADLKWDVEVGLCPDHHDHGHDHDEDCDAKIPPVLNGPTVLSTFGLIFDNFYRFELYQTSFLDVKRLLSNDHILPEDPFI